MRLLPQSIQTDSTRIDRQACDIDELKRTTKRAVVQKGDSGQIPAAIQWIHRTPQGKAEFDASSDSQ